MSARRLLDLTLEYRTSVESRADDHGYPGIVSAGREPDEIAADYEATLRDLLG